MSKMDNLRAMREARYERAAARAGQAPRPKPAAPAAPVSPGESVDPESAAPDAATDEQRCGHRNMSGRTCTRERGHTAKSHRYS